MRHIIFNIISFEKGLPGFLKYIFLLAIALFIPWELMGQQLAFPGAEGFGKYTTGGRGGEVYFVTNLDDSGPGSLREGIEMEGARNILFKISGTVELNSELRIRNNNISIFGQTAPGDGIAIKGAMTVIDADNVIIQYIRFRPGDIGDGEPDALWGREQSDIMLDHLSMSWSVDETGSFYDNQNFTLQWSILSESLYESQHDKGRHGYGGIWGGAGASFHHNLFAHHYSRNPRFNGARYTTTQQTELVDFRNNVIYNWGGNSSYGGEEGNHNMVANYYKAGPATGSNKDRILDARTVSSGFDFGKWYIEENYVDGYPEITEDNWAGGVQRVSESEMEYIRVHEPFEAPALESFETAEEAFVNVLGYAGAILPKRDTIDARIVHETETGTATYGGAYNEDLGLEQGLGIIDTQEEVGGWPELLSATPPEDTDEDGIPDEWETENGLDPNDPDDSREINESGYSNLESYIHTIQEQTEFTPTPGSITLIYPIGETDVSVQPEFSWDQASFADEYELEIRNGAGEFADIILDTVVANTEFNYPEDQELAEDETYFWRVRGLNEEGAGPWSDFEFFVTETTTSSEIVHGLPSEFTLEQNYPNPFNPTTEIRYGLPHNAHVEVRVYDMAGREVAMLLNESQPAGYHTIRFDASSLSSGVYIYRLKGTPVNGSGNNNYILTKKMTLIK